VKHQRLLTRTDMAERMQISERHLDRLLKDHEAPIMRLGKKAIRMLEEDFEAWLVELRDGKKKPKKVVVETFAYCPHCGEST